MTSLVILADQSANDSGARKAATKLAALGYAVGGARDATRAKIGAARQVIVLWSRTARGTPALKAAARKAKADGKLVCVRVDGALPPGELGGPRAARLPQGRLAPRTLKSALRINRRPLAPDVRPAPAPPRTRRAVRRADAVVTLPKIKVPKPRPLRAARRGPGVLAGLSALVLITLAFGAEAYSRDTRFAARVQAAAAQAQARATQLVSALAQR